MQLDADERRQAIVSQEIADIKGRIMAADESLAREIQRQEQKSANVDKKINLQTPKYREHEMTPRDISAFYSGVKSSLNDKSN